MARSFRTAPWALIGVVLLALWAWSTHVASPSSTGATPSTSAEGERRQNANVAAESAGGADGSRSARGDSNRTSTAPTAADSLPAEARDTLQLIARGGPFPHRQDGGTFGNRERQLPPQPRGWYREYTVDTPGSRDRGARRIIAGGDPPSEFYYTDDHYRSFRRIPGAAGAQ